jgi:hypothetical protein
MYGLKPVPFNLTHYLLCRLPADGYGKLYQDAVSARPEQVRPWLYSGQWSAQAARVSRQPIGARIAKGAEL